MHCLHICVLSVTFCGTFTLVLESGSKCVTPNGENATCISINDCRIIKQAIIYLDDDSFAFAKKSLCGYDDGALVCCGSVSYALISTTEIIKTTSEVTQTTPAAPIPSPTPPAAAKPIATLCDKSSDNSKAAKIIMLTYMLLFMLELR